MKGSYRTTILGLARAFARVGAILAVLNDQPKWVPVVGLVLGEAASLLQSWAMRDEKVSDEQAGAGQVVR